jgi:hypothetical protein
MTENDISPVTSYEPPRIEARTALEGLLNPVVVSAAGLSAAFRPL